VIPADRAASVARTARALTYLVYAFAIVTAW
jgi:hypothetical protein